IYSSIIRTYYIRYSCIFESIDGLVFTTPDTIVLFEITLAKGHEIKEHGLTSLLQLLLTTIRNIPLVFIIPENYTQHCSKY
ncbi:hypothetical protein HOY80DRAFT_1068324, partial [Tuber brumale]